MPFYANLPVTLPEAPEGIDPVSMLVVFIFSLAASIGLVTFIDAGPDVTPEGEEITFIDKLTKKAPIVIVLLMVLVLIVSSFFAPPILKKQDDAVEDWYSEVYKLTGERFTKESLREAQLHKKLDRVGTVYDIPLVSEGDGGRIIYVDITGRAMSESTTTKSPTPSE